MSENMQQCTSCGELVPIEYVLCVWCGYDLTGEHIRRSGIQIGRKEAFGRMKKVIVSPIQAFKEISLIPELKGGRWVLYMIGIAMTLNMLAVFSKLENMSFNGEEAEFIITTRISIPVTFIILLTFLLIQPLVLLMVFTIVWKVGTRIVVIMAQSFGGSGDREKVRAVLGYSMIPVLLAWSLSWLIRLITSSTSGDVNDYSDVEASVVTVTQDGFLGGLANGLITIGWIWATVLGIIGISKSTRISYAEAIIVAGLPYLLFMSIVT